MRSLGEIEDKYKESFEMIVEAYRGRLKDSKTKRKARDLFNRDLKKILKKRNVDYKKYLEKNKDKLLGLPEKKKKKEEKFKVYKAYNFEFNHSFWENLKIRFNLFAFHFKLRFRSFRYNFLSSWMKFFFFRLGIFFHSVFFDIGNFIRRINHRISFVFNKKKDIWKTRIKKVSSKIKSFLDKIKAWLKKRSEEKKKKEQEALEKKQKEIADKQKKAEEEENADQEAAK
jgi:hypothetical protein